MDDSREQDRRRLAEAVQRDRPLLTRLARRRLPERADAEDVVSDVVLRLFERADLLAQVENLTAYLVESLGHRIADLFRRPRPAPLPEEEEWEDPAALAALLWQENRAPLERALARLPEAERAVWLAVEMEGWSFRELAATWNEPLGTLLSRKSRATRRLRAMLAAPSDETATP